MSSAGPSYVPPLKSLERTSVVAWAGSSHQSHRLAAGTKAGSIDISWDSSSVLEILGVDIGDVSNTDLVVLGTTPAPDRFTSIAWSSYSTPDFPDGIIVTGMADGSLILWNPAEITASSGGDAEAIGLLSVTPKHSGPVAALDINPSQEHLIATGGPNAETFIWDISNPREPKMYEPGVRVKKQVDITSVAWNCEVPHILGVADAQGFCVVWDLRARKPSINFSPSKPAASKAIAWNPSNPTEMVVAYDDGESGVLRLWDLRNVFSSPQLLEGHTAAVWALSWCPYDKSLLLSTGADGHTFCWNVERRAIKCEVETTAAESSWNFDVQWSAKVPALFLTASLNGKIKVHSLVDPAPRAPSEPALGVKVDYSAPPGWLRPPVALSCGFGNVLVSSKGTSSVYIEKLPAATEYARRATKLEQAIAAGSVREFCDEKISNVDSSSPDHLQWKALKALFEPNRDFLRQCVGHDANDTIGEVRSFIKTELDDGEDAASSSSSPPSPSSTETHTAVADKAEAEEEEEEEEKLKEESITGDGAPDQSKGDGDGDGVSSLFGAGAGTAASDDPFSSLPHSPAVPSSDDAAAAIIVPGGGGDGDEDGGNAAAAPAAIAPLELSSEGSNRYVERSLLVGDFHSAVEVLFRLGRFADALIVAAGDADLLRRTRDRYVRLHGESYTRLASSLQQHNLLGLVGATSPRQWKATLALLCTYARTDEEFRQCVCALGDVLEAAGETDAALFCYVCGTHLAKAVELWSAGAASSSSSSSSSSGKDASSPRAPPEDAEGGEQELITIIEKAAVMRAATGLEIPATLAQHYRKYGLMLANEGEIPSALQYLLQAGNENVDDESAMLLDRLYRNVHGMDSNDTHASASASAPPFPFDMLELGKVHEGASSSSSAAATTAAATPPATPTAPAGTPTGPTTMFSPPSGVSAPGPAAGVASAGVGVGVGVGGMVAPMPTTTTTIFNPAAAMPTGATAPSPLGGVGSPSPAALMNHPGLGGTPVASVPLMPPTTTNNAAVVGGAAPPLVGGGGGAALASTPAATAAPTTFSVFNPAAARTTTTAAAPAATLAPVMPAVASNTPDFTQMMPTGLTPATSVPPILAGPPGGGAAAKEPPAPAREPTPEPTEPREAGAQCISTLNALLEMVKTQHPNHAVTAKLNFDELIHRLTAQKLPEVVENDLLSLLRCIHGGDKATAGDLQKKFMRSSAHRDKMAIGNAELRALKRIISLR